MKLVILVFFLLVLPMFSSGIVETLHLDNVNHEVKEVVMNGRRIDLEMDYTGPHTRPPILSDGPTPRAQVDEVVTKERPLYIKDDYMDPAPVPIPPRPRPYESSPPPPPHHKPLPPPPPPHHKSLYH